jgi:hypothetical protein
MTTITDADIKELKDFINSRFDELEKGQKALEIGQKALEIGQAEIKGQIAVIDSRLQTLESSSQKIPDLAEKVGELKNWKQIALTLGGTLIGGIITYLIKNPHNP